MKRHPARFYGIIAGVATIGYYLLFYAIAPRLFFHLGVYWSSFLIPLVAMVWAGRKERQGQEVYPWQIALRTPFAVYAYAALLYYLFYFLFFNYGDPQLADMQADVLLENLEKSRAYLGDREVESLRREIESAPPGLTPGAALLSFARSLLGGFLLSLLIAFALRKE